MIKIVIEVVINSTIDRIWQYWTKAPHIKEWYIASEDWWVPSAKQDFQVGKTFDYRLESKDQSMGFDFSGTFTSIEKEKKIIYLLEDNRQVETVFSEEDGMVKVTQLFDSEDSNSAEMQKKGWQAILNKFKTYCEAERIPFMLERSMDASPEKLWSFLTEQDLYKKWAYVFAEGSRFIGKWAENEEMTFVDGHGGTVCKITCFKENRTIELSHYSIMNDGVADTDSEAAKKWIGTKERYNLQPLGHGTNFQVYMYCHQDFVEYMRDTWIKALKVLNDHVIGE